MNLFIIGWNLNFNCPIENTCKKLPTEQKLMTFGNSSWVDLVKERGVSGEILENSNFWNLHNKITENMAGTITPSKHKYMSDFHPPEKNSGSTHGTTQCWLNPNIVYVAMHSMSNDPRIRSSYLSWNVKSETQSNSNNFVAESSFKLRYDLHVHV